MIFRYPAPFLRSALWLTMFLHLLTQPCSASYCCTNCSCQSSDSGLVVSTDCTGRGWYSLPADFSMSLQNLRISSNTIVNPWTPDLFKLKNIMYLDLSENNINQAPNVNQFENYDEQLNILDLLDGQTYRREHGELKPNNQILPEPMKTLIFLDLSGNSIKRLGNNSFYLFPSLKVLNISNNLVQILEPGSFCGLHVLRVLNMYNNSLGMSAPTYPLLVFTDLGNLTKLNLLGNVKAIVGGKTYPDQALSQIVSLNRLLIDGIPHPNVPGLGFRSLTKLRYLHFGDSQQEKCFINVLSGDFFANIVSKEALKITFQFCVIQKVDPHIFSKLFTLKKLKLISSNMGFDNFAIASQSFYQTQLEYLDITGINRPNFTVLKYDSISFLRNVSLHTLIIEKSHIINIEPKAIESLPKTVQRLSLANNKIISTESLFSFNFMISLEVLDVSNQNNYRAESRLTHESITRADKTSSIDITVDAVRHATINISDLMKIRDKFCQGYQQDWGPMDKLIRGEEIVDNFSLLSKTISLSKRNGVHNLRDFFRPNIIIRLPRKLKQILANDLKLGYSVPKLQFFNSNLIELANFSNNMLICLDGPVYGFHRLQHLNLSNNFCSALSPYFVKDVPALRKLMMQFNNIGYSLEADTHGETFSKLISLEYIDISHNAIRTLHPKVFSRSPNLHTIMLNNNVLQNFDIDVKNLNNLTFVDLSTNALATLSHQLMTSLDALVRNNPDLTLDLYDNPLLCDCSNAEFTVWYIKTRLHFRRNDLYKCQYVNGSVIQMEGLGKLQEMTWRYCTGEQIFVPVLTSFLMTLATLTGLGFYFYFRVRLLFYIYISKARYFRNFTGQGPTSVKDVFVVYDDQEIRWRRFAIKVVKPELEVRGVTVYISEMDALAGRPFRTVIEESVLAARKTLVLLTSELFHTEERELEINMAKLSEEMRLTDVLYFIRVQHVQDGSMPRHVHKYLEEKAPIEYRHNDPTFWDEIAKIIKSQG